MFFLNKKRYRKKEKRLTSQMLKKNYKIKCFFLSSNCFVMVKLFASYAKTTLLSVYHNLIIQSKIYSV